MTMAGLTEYPDRFAAGASFVGVVDFETFFANTEPWMAAVSKVEYGDPDTRRNLLRSLSPIHKIDRVIAPTIVVHGAHDTNAPVEESQQIVDNLKKRGVPVEYVLIPDEGHDFRKTSIETQRSSQWSSGSIATSCRAIRMPQSNNMGWQGTRRFRRVSPDVLTNHAFDDTVRLCRQLIS